MLPYEKLHLEPLSGMLCCVNHVSAINGRADPCNPPFHLTSSLSCHMQRVKV